jgi:hypothetical protein
MKKIITNLFKTVEQKNKVQLITELLTLDCTIKESVEMFDIVKANYYHALAERQKQNEFDNQLINKTIQK